MPVPDPDSAAAHISLPPGQYRAAIFTVLLTISLGALDQTIVSVAVPTIARELGDAAWLAWVISGYLLASTVATPLYGKFADTYGRRSVLMAAILLFVGASVGCALARSLPQLVVARVLQGLGGGGLIVLAQSVIADIVPLRERGRMQGYFSVVWVTAGLLGPLVGGVLTQWLGWPSIFWINLPAGAAALAFAYRALAPLSARRSTSAVDWRGAALLLAGLTALLVPITRIGQGVPPVDAVNLILFAAALGLLAGFRLQDRTSASPMLPVALLREPGVSVGCTLLFVTFFLLIALSVLVPMRLQHVLGMSAAHSAVLLLPLTLSVPAAVFLGGRWMLRHARVRPLQRLGVVLVPIALVLVALIDPALTAASCAALVVLGCGFGLQMPTAMLTVQSSVPRPLLGTATALTVFFRLLGGAVGVAVLSAILFATMGSDGAQALQRVDAESALASSRATSVHLSGDAPFRVALLAGALLSLVSVWRSRLLPDVHLHGGKLELSSAAAAGE